MELLDRLLRRDDGGDGRSDGDDEDLLFDDGDDLSDFEEGDDLGGFDDDLGSVDGDGGGPSTAELESRIDELENEVGSLSSTVSTIRSENEEISNTVEDVEENVRKLLDIYEMVTRGVNPFVDDVQAGGVERGGAADGSIGLFDEEEAADDDEELDDDIANADAEDFFDDDFLGDDADPGVDEFDDADDGAERTNGDSGTSFAELKDEYESGEADWVDGDATNGEAPDDVAESTDEEDPDDPSAAAGDIDDVAATFDDPTVGAFEESTADVEAPTADADSADQTADETAPTATAADEGDGRDDRVDDVEGAGDLQFAANTIMEAGDGPVSKPYVETLPSGYAGDLLVMEWLEYLVEEGGVDDAARAVEYYRRVQWIGEAAADELHEFLAGYGDVDAGVTDAPTDLSIDHHVASLRYISKLTGATTDSLVFECWGDVGGVPFGL